MNSKLVLYTECSSKLWPNATIRKFRIVQKEGACEVGCGGRFYTLGATTYFGYRVNAPQTTSFCNIVAAKLREQVEKLSEIMNRNANG